MDNIHQLTLIDGKFTPSEARKVILGLIGSKINYHNLEAFSVKERFNGDVCYSEKRIEALKEAERCLEEIINYTSAKGLNLKVQSVIKLTFIEKSE